MLVLSIISVFVLAWSFYYFFKKNIRDPISILGLIVKLISGISLGLIYKYYYQGGDTFQYFYEAETLTNFIFQKPDRLIEVLFNTARIPELIEQLEYSDHPRALFFTKLILPFYLLSGANYWILSLFLSSLNFICLYYLVEELRKSFSALKRESALVFYFLPTFVFWTSGLLKESLAIGALSILIAVCLRTVRMQNFFSLKYWIIIVVSAFVLWELKYFYAGIAFPVAGGFILFSFMNSRRKVSVYLIPLFLVLGIIAISSLHYNLNFSHVADVIYQNYLTGVEKSGGKAITYFHFDGRFLGYILNIPIALFSGLYRPLPFESTGVLPLLAGIENLLVLILTIVGLWKSNLRLKLNDPAVLLTVIYVLSLAILLAFSTPNFGTLSRFKVGFWPFFVLLVLALNKKSQALKT